MSINVSAIQEFTTAEQLKIVNAAIASVSLGQSYSINGKSLTRANLSDLRSWRAELKVEIAEDASDGNLTAYARFGEPG